MNKTRIHNFTQFNVAMSTVVPSDAYTKPIILHPNTEEEFDAQMFGEPVKADVKWDVESLIDFDVVEVEGKLYIINMKIREDQIRRVNSAYHEVLKRQKAK